MCIHETKDIRVQCVATLHLFLLPTVWKKLLGTKFPILCKFEGYLRAPDALIIVETNTLSAGQLSKQNRNFFSKHHTSYLAWPGFSHFVIFSGGEHAKTGKAGEESSYVALRAGTSVI